ncbi:MAG: hypothetical protein KF861_24790, partial [Planctomycetaceae bacterium]|nr:hypothetical protein [Planctomycetaceae bacterium]
MKGLKRKARNTRMWCAGCQTDVAGEISADGQSLRCASCGGEVSSVRTPSLHAKTREIRNLLERWSTEEMLDPELPVKRVPPSPQPEMLWVAASAMSIPPKPKGSRTDPTSAPSPSPPIEQEVPRPRRKSLRLDTPHQPRAGSAAPVPDPHPQRTSHTRAETRTDEPHAETPAPHFNLSRAFEGEKSPGRGESLLGQSLAYVGILVLTIGTLMVVLGYFGGDAGLAPTGWLLATAGQFLLFLGVVTLVSGGM